MVMIFIESFCVPATSCSHTQGRMKDEEGKTKFVLLLQGDPVSLYRGFGLWVIGGLHSFGSAKVAKPNDRASDRELCLVPLCQHRPLCSFGRQPGQKHERHREKFVGGEAQEKDFSGAYGTGLDAIQSDTGQNAERGQQGCLALDPL
jgi:hypothetical protein